MVSLQWHKITWQLRLLTHKIDLVSTIIRWFLKSILIFLTSALFLWVCCYLLLSITPFSYVPYYYMPHFAHGLKTKTKAQWHFYEQSSSSLKLSYRIALFDCFLKSSDIVRSLSQYFSKPAVLQKHISVQLLQGTVTQITKADEPLTLAMAKPSRWGKRFPG